MSGLALSRRHQGHCNEIDRGGEGGGGAWKGRTRKSRASRQRLVMLKSEGPETYEISHMDQNITYKCY